MDDDTTAEVPPADESLGTLLIQGRHAKGWTQRRAAREAGVSDATWRYAEQGYRWVRGEKVPTTPNADSVRRMADALGLPVKVLMKAARRPVADQPHVRTDDEGGYIIELPPGTPPRVVRQVEQIVRALLAEEPVDNKS